VRLRNVAVRTKAEEGKKIYCECKEQEKEKKGSFDQTP